MNYDLFLAPQAVTRNPALSPERSPSGKAPEAQVTDRGQGAVDLAVVDSAHIGEISSDDNQTKKVQQAVEMVNRLFDRSPVDLNMSIDEDTKSLVIKLVDRSTHEVVRQIPPEEILRLRQHLQELLGVVFDQTA